MSSHSVKLHRVIKASPEKVYRAFTEAKALEFWLPPYGYLCTVHSLDPTKGGKYRMSFQNFSTANSHSFGGEFLDIKKNEFIKWSDSFDDPKMPGEIITSITISKTSVGTDLNILQENIPKAMPVEMCYLGWQECLDKLIRLVEPEIPDTMS